MCDPARWSELYLDVLVEALEAERVEIVKDGCVSALARGRQIAVECVPGDPACLHLWTSVECDRPPVEQAAICEDVNARVFGAKFLPMGDRGCVCAVQMPVAGRSCLPDATALTVILATAMTLVSTALEEFRMSLTLLGIELASGGRGSSATVGEV